MTTNNGNPCADIPIPEPSPFRYQFKKSHSERYDFTRIAGKSTWAIITIDENGGLLSIQSDYGDWSFAWPRHGRESFKHFLIEMGKDEDYFIKKVVRGEREVDNERIRKHCKEMILDRRIPRNRPGLFKLVTGRKSPERVYFLSTLSKEDAAACWEEADDLGPYEKIDFLYEDVLHQKEALRDILFDGDLQGISEIAFTQHPHLAHRFFREVYVQAFIPELKKELGL